MTNDELRESYFNWLCDQIHAGGSYSLLMKSLMDHIFRYSVSFDENREADGLNCRDRFCYDIGYDDTMILHIIIGECRFLEVLVALSYRCENDIMSECDGVDRTYFWFWSMMDNCGLSAYDDEHYDSRYVDFIIGRILDRTYDIRGFGGLFPIRNPLKNQRKVEIWTQMASWLQENFPECSHF